jgi:lipopolysaccharide biosynthesis glycosyltransferase
MEIPVYVGYDPRESVAFHVFCHSVLSRTKAQVSFTPVCGEQGDASNTFSKARFLVPEMQGLRGWGIWADGDMLCRADIQELWDLRESGYDVMVVKHDYRTKHPVKYLGQRNEDYPCKNWSSLMLINCGNAVWRRPSYKELFKGPAGLLHRFSFLEDERIGELPREWNHLVSEYDYDPNAKLVHYTIGIPPFYPSCDYSGEWFNEMRAMNYHEHWDQTALVSER